MNARMRERHTCSFLNTKSFTKSTVYGVTAPRRTEPVTPSDDPQMNRVTRGIFLISARNWSISMSFVRSIGRCYLDCINVRGGPSCVQRRFDHEVGHWRVIVSGRSFHSSSSSYGLFFLFYLYGHVWNSFWNIHICLLKTNDVIANRGVKIRMSSQPQPLCCLPHLL